MTALLRPLVRLLLVAGALLAAPAVRAADLTVTVTDGNGRPVADAVVIAEAAGASPAAGKFEITQRNMAFAPHVLVIPVGSTIEFGNLDPFRHHVYSFSPARKFELRLFGQGDDPFKLLGAFSAQLRRVAQTARLNAQGVPLHEAMTRAGVPNFPAARQSAEQLMRHLGYLDRALATQGLKALTEVPVEVLAASLEQLDAIVSNWSDRHLADLRSRLAVAVKERSLDEFGNQLSDFATASRLLVDDVAHSEFEALERQYEGLVSPETIQAALEAIRTPYSVEQEATTAIPATESVA